MTGVVPCPMCCSTSRIEATVRPSGRFLVTCGDCFDYAPDTGPWIPIGGGETREQAIDDWNEQVQATGEDSWTADDTRN